jgi:hypothetical protein
MIHTILFALGIIFLIAVAIALIALYGRMATRKKKAELTDLYNHIVFNHSLDITIQDRFTNRLIAVDEVKKILLYIDNSQALNVQLIKLKDVAHCKIGNSGIEVIERKSQGRSALEDHSKDLSITIVLRNRSVIDLPIYNEMQDGPLQRSRLMDLAGTWVSRINTSIGRSLQLISKD